jgi:3-oxoacyl-[acyl-carrier-protein] synthase II
VKGPGVGPRVVVTGVGSVGALGAGGGAVVPAVLESGRSALGRVTAFPTDGLSSHLAAELPPGALASLIDPAEGRRLSRITQMTLAACRLAVADAALGDLSRAHLIVGTEFGDLRSTEEFATGFLRRGVGGLSPLAFPNTVMNAMAAATAIALGLRGPSITLNARRVAGELAVARGAALVAGGRASAVLAGGVDELSPLMFQMLARLRAISPRGGSEEGCRPYDRAASGPVRGEGATFLVLEPLDGAAARGARLLGEIRAAAWRSGHRAGAIRPALEAAGLEADGLGWVYGSAAGDPAEDAAELESIWRAFGPAGSALTALAPLAGEHAGLGPFRVAAGTWTARSGRLPGIASLREPRPAARGLAVGPGLHSVPPGPGLVHGISRRGDEVALVVSVVGPAG